MAICLYLLTILYAYLLGSIPTAYLAGKARGIDIRTAGSGNSGATNALRVLGRGPAAIVLAVDAAKGGLAVLGVPPLVLWLVILWSNLIPGPASLFLEPLSLPLVAEGGTLSSWQIFRLVFFSVEAVSLLEAARTAAGAACVAGHVFPPWLGFRGGKGVATGAAVVFVLAPKAAIVCLAVFILVVAVSRYVSLASISAALILPVAYAALYRGESLSPELLGFCAVAAILIIAMHRRNIGRLLAGTEPRLGGSG